MASGAAQASVSRQTKLAKATAIMMAIGHSSGQKWIIGAIEG
jgi:hypothetical protein